MDNAANEIICHCFQFTRGDIENDYIKTVSYTHLTLPTN